MCFLMSMIAAMLLAGCNTVSSKSPLFTDVDTLGSPGLRPGLWISADRDCPVLRSASASSWPDCANAFLVEANHLQPLFRDEESVSFVLASGDPMILQFGGKDLGGETSYSFMGVRQTRKDWNGRATAISAWWVMCGSYPPDGTLNADGSPRFVTLSPGSGLEIDGNGCLARDAKAVRAAAAASKRLSPAISLSWVRERP